VGYSYAPVRSTLKREGEGEKEGGRARDMVRFRNKRGVGRAAVGIKHGVWASDVRSTHAYSMLPAARRT